MRCFLTSVAMFVGATVACCALPASDPRVRVTTVSAIAPHAVRFITDCPARAPLWRGGRPPFFLAKTQPRCHDTRYGCGRQNLMDICSFAKRGGIQTSTQCV